MRVSITVAPVAGVVVSRFQTALLRRFPFVVRLYLNTLVGIGVVLVLIGVNGIVSQQVVLYLGVVGPRVPSEVIVCAADV